MSDVDDLMDKALQRQFPYTLKLTVPVKLGDEVIDELVFQKGKIGDGRGVKFKDEVSGDLLIMVASRLCGQPQKVIELLDIDDGGEAMEIAMDFCVRYLTARRKR